MPNFLFDSIGHSQLILLHVPRSETPFKNMLYEPGIQQVLNTLDSEERANINHGASILRCKPIYGVLGVQINSATFVHQLEDGCLPGAQK